MENFIQDIAIWALPVLFAITVHEVAHGYVAHKLGDSTAFMLGRLTLNPIKHIDLVGTILVPIVLFVMTKGQFMFGWAKPVPINHRNLKNYKRDTALVAIAGPLSNFLMALGWALILKLSLALTARGLDYALAMMLMAKAGILINLILGVLNLIPIPPLDGSRVVASFLPLKLDYYYHKLEPFGFLILIGLMFVGILQSMIRPPILYLQHWLLKLMGIL